MNLLDLVQHLHLSLPPRKVAGTHGGEWHSPCPVCGGKDRFHFWPERQSSGFCTVPGVWGCRVCDTSGDAIAFLQFTEKLSFKDACQRLGLKLQQDEYRPVKLPRSREEKQKLEVTTPCLPNIAWRERCAKLVAFAHETLLATPEPLAWLAARGLDEEAVHRFHLGWLPGERLSEKKGGGFSSWYVRPRKAWGLPDEEKNGKPCKVFRFPRGLVIPHFQDGEVIGLRIRRTDADRTACYPDLKYVAFKGSSVRPFIILPEPPLEASGMVLQESHLDAMLLAEVGRRAGIACGAIALVSNTAHPDPVTDEVCRKAVRLLLGLDFDPDGSGGKAFTDRAVAKWLATYPRAKDWPLPDGKDAGEAFERGVDLAIWLKAGLPPMCWDFASIETVGALLPDTTQPMEQGDGGEIPYDVQILRGLMQRFSLQIRINEWIKINGREQLSTLGLVYSSSFRRDRNHYFSKFSRLVFHSPAVLKWLDTHPVQAGRITAYNLLQRSEPENAN